MRHEISNSDDIIDSRDVIARIDELESIEGIEDKINALEEDDEAKELVALRELANGAEGYSDDWRYGATLVRDSYWVEYCEDLVKDTGDMPRDIPHYVEIDWNATAENIKADYTAVEFDGVTYWVR
jgi:antirestriction protein